MEPIRTCTLPNGIRLVALTRTGGPLAAALLHVRVGSADEEPGERGLAHVLEHVVVRCAMRGGRVGDGALVTARTGKESTEYSIVVRDADIIPAITTLGSAFHDLDVPSTELAAELAAIREERVQRSGDPAWRLQTSLFGTLWSDTRCAHAVLGAPRVVDRLTPAHIRRFHRAWYRAANAVLVIVADRPSEVLPAVIAIASTWRDVHPAVGGPSSGRPMPPRRPTERPASAGVAMTDGPAAGVAIAQRRAGAAASLLACDAVKTATGLVVQTLPLRGWRCTWAMVTAPELGTARDMILAALTATHDRIAGPDGTAWLRTDVIIPRLRREDDIETVAARAADSRTAIRPDDLVACQAGTVAELLTDWRRRFSAACSAASAGGLASTRSTTEHA